MRWATLLFLVLVGSAWADHQAGYHTTLREYLETPECIPYPLVEYLDRDTIIQDVRQTGLGLFTTLNIGGKVIQVYELRNMTKVVDMNPEDINEPVWVRGDTLECSWRQRSLDEKGA